MDGFQLYLETYSVIFLACSCLSTFLILALFFFLLVSEQFLIFLAGQWLLVGMSECLLLW